VLAPNLTIYNKLIADFTPNTPKYVFKGIAEFATDEPEIITAIHMTNAVFSATFIASASIFSTFPKSIPKCAAGMLPVSNGFRNTSAQSYFDYLAGLPDLVLLMMNRTATGVSGDSRHQ